MTFLRYTFIATIICCLGLSQVQLVEAAIENINIARAAPYNAVGYVNVEGSEGVATYIGENLLISAAHVFLDLLPDKTTINKTSGPVEKDLRTNHAYWANVENSRRFGSRQERKIVKVVVDASYIHAATTGDPNKHTRDEVSRDIAVVVLEKVPSDVTPIPLIDEISPLPQIGMMVGYGKADNGKKRAMLQRIMSDPEGNLNSWGLIVAPIPAPNFKNFIEQNPRIKQQAQDLLTQQPRDLLYLMEPSTNGDSGGPLVVSTPQGLRVIGIMSGTDEKKSGRQSHSSDSYSDESESWTGESSSEGSQQSRSFTHERSEEEQDSDIGELRHEFPSIVIGAGNNYRRNPAIQQMINEAKRR